MDSIELPFGIDDLDKIFVLSEFLDNKDELLKEFQPEVQKFLVKKDFFTGPFRREYQRHFDELIVKLIKQQITKHFNFSPEEVLLLTDTDFLKLLTGNVYFDQENYKPNIKDGMQ